MRHPRLVRAAGTAGEPGESIGVATGERIRALLTAQDHAHRNRDGLTLHGWLPAARRFEPLIREHAPVTAAEMAGMAAGAELPADELLLLACVYEKHMGPAPAPGTDGHCTAFGAAGDATVAGDVICGQKTAKAIAGWLGGAADVIVHHTGEDGLQTLIYSHAGVPACMGMNSAGLCVTWMDIDDGERGAGLPTRVLARELLIMRGITEAVDYERTPRAVPNAYLLGHPDCAPWRCSPSRMCSSEGSGLLWHANHILDSELATADRQTCNPEATTFSRYERMGELVCADRGHIDVAPRNASCPLTAAATRSARPAAGRRRARQDGGEHGVEPAAGTMHLPFGNGCEEPRVAYRFDP